MANEWYKFFSLLEKLLMLGAITMSSDKLIPHHDNSYREMIQPIMANEWYKFFTLFEKLLMLGALYNNVIW